MLIKQFLEWFTVAPTADRKEAAEALCEAYLAGYLAIEDPADTEAALTLLLDDPSVTVRKAVTDAFSSSEKAPRHLVVSLCYDQHEVSVPVIARSPLLTDADLIDCLAVGDALTQMAVATREGLSRAVCAAVCEVGCIDAAVMLAKNEVCDIPSFGFARLAERFGDDARLRTALLDREDLPLVVRHALVIKVSEHLTEMVCRGQWMPRTRVERLLDDARQAATVLLLGAAAPDEVSELVEHMRVKGELTPSLLLRALLSRDLSLFEAAMTSLTGLPGRRVHALLHERSMTGFTALYRRAKMPPSLEAAFRAAVQGVLAHGRATEFGEEPRLSRSVIQAVLVACAADSEDSRIMGLLRRLEAEAVREDARRLTTRMLSAASSIEFDMDNRVAPALTDASQSNALDGVIDFAAIEQELVSFAAAVEATEPQAALVCDDAMENQPEPVVPPEAVSHASTEEISTEELSTEEFSSGERVDTDGREAMKIAA
ncbi:MAG: DUF2336 domain-containing protein [Beijerinckiaceae bacterium]|nr:DUF2336 domain-containing protein [Beijerinckiaceae bacterium]